MLALPLAAEIYLRVRHGEVLVLQSRPMIYVPDDIQGYRYRPNAEGRLRIPSIDKHVRINSLGYSGPEFSKHKADGVYRVAVLGSSLASGIWLNSDECYPKALQRKLTDSGHPIEVINCSVDGAYRGLAKIRQAHGPVLDLEPDLVLLALNLPILRMCWIRETYSGYVFETGFIGMPEEQIDHNRGELKGMIDAIESRSLLQVLKRSYIARAWSRRLDSQHSEGTFPGWAAALNLTRQKRIHAGGWGAYLTEAETVEVLEWARTEGWRRGSRLMIIANDAETVAFCRKHRFTYAQVEVPDDPGLRHAHDGHLNEAGHDVVADWLVPAVVGMWNKNRQSLESARK
ncbi:MAG: hypothetical protein GY711_06120 [bacterium]|nr:hypothetical protein [bacterium]